MIVYVVLGYDDEYLKNKICYSCINCHYFWEAQIQHSNNVYIDQLCYATITDITKYNNNIYKGLDFMEV